MTALSSAASPERALITGATSGLGLEFARQLAESGYALVLVARNEERLNKTAESIAEQFQVEVDILPADLTDRDQLEWVADRLTDDASPVTMLVNNAGFGITQPFHESGPEIEQRHLDVLVTATMRLTQDALGPMRAKRHGTIIQVASAAAYRPSGTYGAAKSWTLSFTRWANLEYRRDGVTVSTVLPGYVRTDWFARLNLEQSAVAPAFFWLEPATVVRRALAGAKRGRAVVIPSLRYKLISAYFRVAPPKFTAYLSPRSLVGGRSTTSGDKPSATEKDESSLA